MLQALLLQRHSVAATTQEQMAPMTGVTLKSSSLLKYWTSSTPSVSGPSRVLGIVAGVSLLLQYTKRKVIDRPPLQ